MKVRFYRGPLDGKIKHIPDHLNYYEVIAQSGILNNVVSLHAYPPISAYPTTRHLYRKTRHSHPDGSIYFEWDKPRGTRT